MKSFHVYLLHMNLKKLVLYLKVQAWVNGSVQAVLTRAVQQTAAQV